MLVYVWVLLTVSLLLYQNQMNKINPPLFQASYAVVKNYAFDGEKLSLELGSFIVTIALGEASYFERILCGITETPPQYVQSFVN